MNGIVSEGGAAGHLSHLTDNRDLTFAELKEIVKSAAEGKLEHVTEKLDGLNCVFTFSDEGLRVARSGGDIKNGGMDATALAAKFQGRGNLTDAFNGAFKVLHDAVSSLSQKVRSAIFKNGTVWYSVEIIYAANPNVVNYDADYVVFHASPVFTVSKSGEVSKRADAPGVELLNKYVTQMQKALTQRNWHIRGPAVLRLKKLSNGAVVSHALARIDAAMQAGDVDDNDTLGTYLQHVVSDHVAELELTPEATVAVVQRCLGTLGAPKLTDIRTMVPIDVYPKVNAFVKNSPQLLKQAIAPLEMAIHDFAIEVLRGLHSVLITNSDAEVTRLRQQVASAVKAIEGSGQQQAMDVLQTQMQKLGNVDNIAAAMEGIVFIYKGNAYKFTGAFAPANQILGLFKYGRGGTTVPTTESRHLQRVVQSCVNKWTRQHLSA